MKNEKHRVLHGFEHETFEAKIENFLRLSPAERYMQMAELSQFLRKLNRPEVNLDDYKSFRKIQILKQPV
ncbi:hypothetical protein GWO43_01975 [candidate division KSB1 bacterium]|nr:hypothetical protein [candidate division KSB1 bacterium]NIR69491.1 hypothetical protein [candidate division KSB1 bacterium]NIS22841.1 hypothetical protein [candidate division KSB1 bacterium]NIT69680.1 hypothetical protein [candidate division KSB1 bacterium]NIU23350.1 hypothetical protein [candidate division KSB1 bacterium]